MHPVTYPINLFLVFILSVYSPHLTSTWWRLEKNEVLFIFYFVFLITRSSSLNFYFWCYALFLTCDPLIFINLTYFHFLVRESFLLFHYAYGNPLDTCKECLYPLLNVLLNIKDNFQFLPPFLLLQFLD